jgi:hypothetical protein
MNLKKGITDTVVSCVYRVKNIPVYMSHFKGALYRLTDYDESAKGLIADISQDSEKLAKKIEQLMQKIKKAPVEEAKIPSNRRQCERLKVEGEGTLIINNNIEKTYQLKDLSSKGLCIIGDHMIQMDASVDIVIASPFLRNSVYKNVRVAWNKKLDQDLWEGGIEFKLNNN